nr:hypothetical protein CFP56_16478 [Quercus suber]
MPGEYTAGGEVISRLLHVTLAGPASRSGRGEDNAMSRQRGSRLVIAVTATMGRGLTDPTGSAERNLEMSVARSCLTAAYPSSALESPCLDSVSPCEETGRQQNAITIFRHWLCLCCISAVP